MQPCELTLAEASAAIGGGDLSATELTESVLERAAAVQETLHPYVGVTPQTALSAAKQADREIADGRYRGPLHGVPGALKDLFDVAGLPTGAGSRVRDGHVAAEDSTVAGRLSDAGTVPLGKTHTHEFAIGVTTPSTANARDRTRIAGGSSGGSAVAVATGAATFAIGSDTGGSVRMPSALNGVVGLKPTYGLISTHGMVPFAWSMDHVGTLTRTVRDAELLLPSLVGYDPKDPASLRTLPHARPPEPEEGLAGVRVGLPTNYFFDRALPDVEAAVRRSVEQLAALGAEIVEIEVPMAEYLLGTAWGILAPEAAQYHEETIRRAPELYGDDVRLLLEAGGHVRAVDHLRARRVRTLMRQAWTRMLDEVDVVATPTTPLTALPIGQDVVQWPDGSTDTLMEAYAQLTTPANIIGVPALTIPAARDDGGLPVGLQLIGRYLGEAALLHVGRVYEDAHGPAYQPAAAPA